MLAVIGKTAVQRMPARINNFGIRKNQANEAQIIPVVGQLIDEKRLVRLALDPRAVDELGTQPLHVVSAQLGKRINPVRPEPFTHCHRRNIGQLHRAFDHRMAGKDLFNQRRSSARHANDENRVGCIMPVPGARFDEFRRKLRDDLVHLPADHLWIMLKFGTPQPIAKRIMCKGRVMIAAFLHRLPKREMQMKGIFLTQIGKFQRSFHCDDIFGRESRCFQIGEAPPDFTKRWLNR